MIERSAVERVYYAYIAAENSRDRTAMERCLASDLSVVINGVPQLADRDADAEATDRLLAAYPDYGREVAELFVDGPTAIAEWVMRGSANPGRGVPALELRGVSIAEVVTSPEGVTVISAARLYTDSSVLNRILESG